MPAPTPSGLLTLPTTVSAGSTSKAVRRLAARYPSDLSPARSRSAPKRSGSPITATARSPASSPNRRRASKWTNRTLCGPSAEDRIGFRGEGHRPALHQHDSHAVDRCDPEGELGPSGDADGDGPGRLHALAALPPLRSGRPDLAQPRPLRALGRARIDAALFAALPGRGAGGGIRLRGRRSPFGLARRHKELSPARLARPWPPRVPLDLRRRDDHRPARAGDRDQRWQGARYGAELFDFDVYAIAGDGCLMEGVSNEAASIAGHLKLDNLCWIYDNNHITIDGKTRIAYEDDAAARFMGYGWNVTRVGDANDIELLSRAFERFREEEERPTLIIVDSHIGYGAPHKQDTAEAHGEPLGEEEIRLTKRSYGWPENAKFLVPEGVYEHFAAGIGARGAKARQEWTKLFDAYRRTYPELAAEIDQMQRREL